jgi:hypothetical protein
MLKRLQAIYLVALGTFNHKTIATILSLTPDTITDYIMLFNERGVLGLKRIKTGHHNVSELGYIHFMVKSINRFTPLVKGGYINSMPALGKCCFKTAFSFENSLKPK